MGPQSNACVKQFPRANIDNTARNVERTLFVIHRLMRVT
jgi:hypothetical protein